VDLTGQLSNQIRQDLIAFSELSELQRNDQFVLLQYLTYQGIAIILNAKTQKLVRVFD
jgi:hypothetical protein